MHRPVLCHGPLQFRASSFSIDRTCAGAYSFSIGAAGVGEEHVVPLHSDRSNRSSCIRWTTFPGSENEVMSERVFSSDGINSIHMHVSFRYLGLYIL